jgi:hypothetical protein
MSDASLDTELKLRRADDIYHALIEMLGTVGNGNATGAFAALALVLANQVGDDTVVLDAIALVSDTFNTAEEDTSHILVQEALEKFFALHPADKFEGFTA